MTSFSRSGTRLVVYDEPLEVSVLGSAAKGIGEARHVDFGITGCKVSGTIYAKGQPLKKVPLEELVDELFKEIDKYFAAGKKVVVVDARQAAEAARWLRRIENDPSA